MAALQRVERERTDVGALVLLLLVEALLEFAVSLETTLLGHCSLLLVGLHHATFLSEFFHLALEHRVLAELALQRTVVERYLDGRLQAYLLEALFAIRQHPGIVARELMLQALAYHLVSIEQVGSRDAFAVGRISHHQRRLGRLLEILEVLQLHGDVLHHTGGAHVQRSLSNSLRVDVVAVDVVLELALLRVVVVDLVKEVLIEVGPFLKGKLLAEQARAHVAGNEGGLDEQRAATAHGVDEVAFAAPARHQDHTCCQHLVQRGLGGLLTIAATMQRLA